MPKREQFFAELGAEQQYGVLLVAQMGGAPNEIQAIVETAEYDAAVEACALNPAISSARWACWNTRASLGVFGVATLTEDHPLLYHHNTPKVAVHFEGKPDDINELVLDVSQAYVSTFLEWRHLVEMPDDLNRSVPLVDLLQRGIGLLGTMPKPLAERMARVLKHHGLNASLSEDNSFESVDDHGRSTLAKALILDSTYIIALDFSFETMGKR
ncbi:MAG: hypothetical protein UZ15_CFX003000020 [Chloroflexi bacterium OLB15]|nr:MAG: hypothetical protein UZ15_CFX003000020 [Chloroflexi bacterium OLB15]